MDIQAAIILTGQGLAADSMWTVTAFESGLVGARCFVTVSLSVQCEERRALRDRHSSNR
jgi:hypothetical protein